jgi:prepilin-type N-terminal cleavage/methylation domain-containing protein/prepilin-type processing-associated H-X9-DG protein
MRKTACVVSGEFGPVRKCPVRSGPTTVPVRSGFTLIEMLVVVAIIALLIALLVPALHDARERALTSVCLSNLHQTELGVQTYAACFAGIIPNNGWVFSGNTGSSQTDPSYFPNVRGVRCPKNDAHTEDPNGVARLNSNTTSNTYAQIWSPDPAQFVNAGAYREYDALFRVMTPSNYVMLVDSVHLILPGGSGNPPSPPCYQVVPPGGPSAVWCFDPGHAFQGGVAITLGKVWDSGSWPGLWLAHRERGNAAFADGHAESCPLSKFYHLANGSLNNQYAGLTTGGSYGAGSFFHTNGVCGPNPGDPTN